MPSFSLYHLAKDRVRDIAASYNITSNLDFLRGEPASKYQPVCIDDMDLHLQPISKVKAVLACSEKKSTTYQRWGGASFATTRPFRPAPRYRHAGCAKAASDAAHRVAQEARCFLRLSNSEEREVPHDQARNQDSEAAASHSETLVRIHALRAARREASRKNRGRKPVSASLLKMC